MLLASALFAQTQQDIYRQALEAEEAGDVSKSIELFEKARDAGGEYTEEINEILAEYYEALGGDADTSEVSFRFLGNLGFYGLHYAEYGSTKDVSENGGDLFASVSGYLDFSTGNWIHSFGVAFVSDWFVTNEDMPVLDTNDWTMAPGLEYSLIGQRLLLDIGVDFNITSEGDFNPAGYGWVEFDIARYTAQRFGVAGSIYYRKDGPATAGVFGSWHRSETQGLNGSAYLGAKYEADYLLDILGYVGSSQEDCERDAWGNCIDQTFPTINFEEVVAKCVAENGDSLCWDPNVFQPYIDAAYAELDQTEDLSFDRYWSRWIGPSFQLRLSYLFKTKISVETKFDLFYAFLVDGASAEYEKMGKFSGKWGLVFNWNPNWLTLYLGAEQTYLRYVLPNSLKDYFPETCLLTSLKAGVKVEF
ncbi:hypothetical protein [Fibrobacter sp.]